MNDKSILIVGVGGQGTLLASRILGNVAVRKGFDVKVSEVHGMSQRGGSVVTYVKYSDSAVHSPLIDDEETDIILAFELLEAYRSIRYLKKGGLMLVNTQRIDPMPVISGTATYPEEILRKLKESGINVRSIDALAVAQEAGNTRTVNTVLIGLLASGSDIPREDWEAALVDILPEKLTEVNKRAFSLGFAIGEGDSK